MKYTLVRPRTGIRAGLEASVMPRKAIEGESRNVQWRLGFDGEDKVRLERALAELFDRHRGTLSQTRFLVTETFKAVVAGMILSDRLEDAHAALGDILGRSVPPAGQSSQSGQGGVGVPIREHATTVSDAATRQMLGQKRWD
jgi:hypothetical protein